VSCDRNYKLVGTFSARSAAVMRSGPVPRAISYKFITNSQLLVRQELAGKASGRKVVGVMLITLQDKSLRSKELGEKRHG